MKPVFLIFSTFNANYIYDRNKNTILPINSNEFQILERYLSGEKSIETEETILFFQKAGYLLPHSIKEIQHYSVDCMSDYLSRKVESVTLQVTQNCNLRCDYCVYSGTYANRNHANRQMNFSTAKQSIDFLFANSSEIQNLNIGFYGGEPLLEFELIKDCVRYVEESYEEKKCGYSITTNGTLLTDEVLTYLFQKRFIILISMDGPQEIHDQHRCYPDGRGSFDDVMHNIRRIRELYPQYEHQVAINTVVSPESNFECVVQFYDTDTIIDSYNPRYSLVNEFGNSIVLNYSLTFLIKSRIEKMKAMLWIIGKLSESRVSNLFRNRKNEAYRFAASMSVLDKFPVVAHPGGPCIAGAKRLFIDVDGRLFPCERVSETSPSMEIGNVTSGFNVEKSIEITNIGSLTREECSKCWGFLHCGQCAAVADDGQKLSRELKLTRCPTTLGHIIDRLKDYCFYIENGVHFEEWGE